MSNWLPKALDPGEFDALLDEASNPSSCKNPEREAAALLLMHDAGLRISEVTTLALPAISLHHKQLRVTGKGGKTAVLPCSARLLDALDVWYQYRPDVDTPWVLCSPGGLKLLPQHYRRLLARLGERALGKHVHPHMLRHTIITELAVDRGVPLPLVKAFARHSNIATTETYLHVRPTWTDEVRSIMDGREL